MEIRVGYFVTDKVGYVEKTREGETRRTRKELVGFLQASQLLPKM